MKRTSLVTAALLILCTACTNVKETPKGLSYTVLRKGDGVIGKSGEFIVMSFVLKNGKDSILFDNRKTDFPEPIRVPDTTNLKSEEGVTEIFRYLSKGDSVTFTLKALDLYTNMKQPLPPKTDPNDMYTFNMGIKDIITQEAFQKLRQDMMVKQKEKFAKDQAIQIGKDTVKIDSVLALKKVIAQKTKSGLRYVVLKKGTGPQVAKGQKVKVDYAGYLLNGKYFDTSIESVGKANGLQRPAYKPMEVDAGMARVIPGFDEAFLLMHKGEKIIVYIPSTLAYGSQKVTDVIVANSVLVFDMEMLDVTNNNQPSKK